MWSQIMRANPLQKFKKSRFRQKFFLDESDVELIAKIGSARLIYDTIQILKAKVKYKLWNDGKQTPYGNHPVFKAMHATATCCRSCLYTWWKIPLNKVLDDREIIYLSGIIELWIRKELLNLNKVYNEELISS